MEFSANQNPDGVVVSIKGQLTFADVGEFENVLKHLQKDGISKANFDLSDLEFVDSTGMSLFVHAYDVSKERNITISVSGAKDKVSAALTKAGFDNLFSVS